MHRLGDWIRGLGWSRMWYSCCIMIWYSCILVSVFCMILCLMVSLMQAVDTYESHISTFV